jgi:hypothetical protein
MPSKEGINGNHADLGVTEMATLIDLTGSAALRAEDMRVELERLREENARLKAGKGNGGMKVTEKGGLSVYGLGRFPVTLYRSQWEALFSRVDDIKAFIKANEGKLAVKE